MDTNKRLLPYDMAINEALMQMMERDKRVFVIGQGVKSPWYVGNTTKGLFGKFGPERVIDTPVSENTMTGTATGAAIVGMRPVVIHPRMDFMIYATDQIVNEAANWRYMFGGKTQAPVVIRAIINRGGEQGAQHSQAIQAWFAHVPGLKVVMPATPYDAKGLLISAIHANDPVMYIDDRWLYQEQEHVPRGIYTVPIGKAAVRVQGKDITIAAISYMVKVAREAAKLLLKEGISAEVIDVRTVKPIDFDLIAASVKKTGRLVVAEAAWRTGCVACTIAAEMADSAFAFLKAPIGRVTLPDCPAPTSKTLEKAYYDHVSVETLINAVKKNLSWEKHERRPKKLTQRNYDKSPFCKSAETV